MLYPMVQILLLHKLLVRGFWNVLGLLLQVFLFDTKGLITAGRGDAATMQHHKKPYVTQKQNRIPLSFQQPAHHFPQLRARIPARCSD